jgi:hypothetical protein
MERIVSIGSNDHTRIKSTDEIGPGGAYHDYEIECLHDLNGTCATVHFQKGGVVEAGLNGCFMEDLIAICIDRLECFQAGPFPCRENALAKTKLEEAMMWLNKRTANRKERGVEGKSIS